MNYLRCYSVFFTFLIFLITCFPKIFWTVQAISDGYNQIPIFKAKKAVTHHIDRYTHDVWGLEDGLPQSSVNYITQTRDGYIWIGTFDGLVRFDGVRFTVFYSGNTEGLLSSRIQGLFEDPLGALWIITENTGLSRFKDGKFSSYTTTEGLPGYISGNIRMFADREGNVWAEVDKKLSRFHNGKFITYSTKDGLPSDDVLGVCVDYDGNIWASTNNGLVQFNNGKFITYNISEELPNNIRVMSADKDGNIWIGTDKGLAKFSNGKITYITGLPSNDIQAIYIGKAGVIWIVTAKGLTKYQNGEFFSYPIVNLQRFFLEDRKGNVWFSTSEGLNQLKDGVIRTYTSKEGLTGDVIRSFYEDHEGNIWVGTNGGLERFKPAAVSVYTKNEGLSDDYILAICEGRDGSLWIGTNSLNGLNRLKDGKVTVYTAKDGLPTGSIWALCEDREGSLWIGIHGIAGLVQFKEGKFKVVASWELIDSSIDTIYEDRKGNIWIGTVRGTLRMLKDEKLTVYTKENGLNGYGIKSIYEDKKGNLWIGTNGGITLFKDGKFINYTKKDGLSDNFVRAIYEDKEGTLWFGTYSNGLNRFRDGKFISYTLKDGLFDHTVSQILEDDNGNFWLSGNKGIYRVKKQELEDFALGKSHFINCTSYGTDEGMKSQETNGGFQPAGCKTRDGRLWFPTVSGVVMIDPNNLLINELPPKLVIEEALIDKISYSVNKTALIPPGNGEIEFHYTGLSFVTPKKMKFKYKLEGFDKDWVDADNRRVAYYTNIAPGNYSFKVIGCNNDGVWNETAAVFNFYLNPHFYQTYTFYSICGLIAILIATSLYMLRIQGLKVREAELVELVEKRTKHLLEMGRELKEANQVIELISSGTIIDKKYRIESQIGQGGMGRVFRVTHIELNKTFALKMMNLSVPQMSGDLSPAMLSSRLARFRREAESLARINHPNVIMVTDFGVVNNQIPYIVMEYVNGQTLRDLLNTEGKLSEHKAVEIAKQLCAGLQEAHLQGVIHRDLKPENIMVQSYADLDIVVRLLDFGIAKILSEANSENLTSDQDLIGTPKYMSPEHIIGTPDIRSDVFGICLITYEMLTGIVPPVLTGLMRPLTELCPGISLELNDVILKGLSQEPNRRQQSALDLKCELEQVRERKFSSQEV